MGYGENMKYILFLKRLFGLPDLTKLRMISDVKFVVGTKVTSHRQMSHCRTLRESPVF